jgi:hypothetical protein
MQGKKKQELQSGSATYVGRNALPRDIEEMKHELENFRSVMTMKWPFLAGLARRCRIVADPHVESTSVTLKNEIHVNPQFLQRMKDKPKAALWCAEALRVAFSHPQRMQGKDSILAKKASDSVVYAVLQAHEFKDTELPEGITLAKEVAALIAQDESEVARMSFEEQYRLLEALQDHTKNKGQSSGGDRSDSSKNEERKGKGTGTESQEHGNKDGKKEKESEGQASNTEEQSIAPENGRPKGEFVIQEGDPEAYDSQKTAEELEAYWQRAIIQAFMQAKMAGTLPLGIAKLLEDLLQPKVDWKSVIKKYIIDGFGKSVVGTWKRVSRKDAMLPGIKHLTKPTVFCLVDTSGSTMFTEALSQFLGEVYGIIKYHGKGIIIPWDAETYPAVELTKVVDLGYAIKKGEIKGGGGTVIAPVLEEVLNAMKRQDIVVVLTDGAIYDLSIQEAQNLLLKVAAKSSCAIFGTMDTGVTIPRKWRKVAIKL